MATAGGRTARTPTASPSEMRWYVLMSCGARRQLGQESRRFVKTRGWQFLAGIDAVPWMERILGGCRSRYLVREFRSYTLVPIHADAKAIAVGRAVVGGRTGIRSGESEVLQDFGRGPRAV